MATNAAACAIDRIASGIETTKWDTIEIIPIVEHNRHEDAVLETRAGSVLTMSSQQACQNRPVAKISDHERVQYITSRVLTCSNPHECRIFETGMQR